MSSALHGGAFWTEVGHDLSRLKHLVKADVLDAWFEPAPSVTEALREHGLEICRTSPERDAAPLGSAISQARNLPLESILAGAGSSALIYSALPLLAREVAAAQILDPMYGEYRHVLESICNLAPRTVTLSRPNGYQLDPKRLLRSETLTVIVNPNSPTGGFVSKGELWPVVEELAASGIVWIDETYIEYCGPGQSLESLAAGNRNVIVCKSMSKVYALSGLRVGYLVSHPDRIAQLAQATPPWAVSLPAQVAGRIALAESVYYAGKYQETARLRARMARAFEDLGLCTTAGSINAILVHLPKDGPTAAAVCRRAAASGVYLRDAGSMGPSMGNRTLRISVRPEAELERIVAAF